MQVLLTAC